MKNGPGIRVAMAASESRTAGVRAWKAEEPPKGPGLRVFFFFERLVPPSNQGRAN